MPTELQSFLRKVEKDPSQKKNYLVEVGDLSKLLVDGTLSFALPGRKGRYLAKTTRLTAQSPTDYVWLGEITDSTGSITLVCKGDQVRGHLFVEKDHYELYPLGQGLHALVEVDTKRSVNDRCELHKVPKQDKKDTPVKGGRMTACGNNLSVARVLILITPAAVAADPNIQMTAQMMVAQVNQAMANSNIGYLDIELAGTPAFSLLPNNESGTNNIVTDLTTLRNHQQVNQLRNQSQADIVIMLTNERYFDADGQTWGIGGDVSFQINPNFGFGIVAVGAGPNSGFTFAHELGHIFGARHQRCAEYNVGGCDPNPGYFHAYSFLGCSGLFCMNTLPRMSIVHQNGKVYSTFWGLELFQRVLNYSNPDVTVSNAATGTRADANNAQTIAERFSAVANYRTSLNSTIDGPSALNVTQTYTWEAVYSCGTAPYTFTWELSNNGFNYSTVGSGEFFSSGAGFLYSSQQAWLRLTVTSSDGQTSSSVRLLQRSSGGFRKANESDTETLNNEKIQLLEATPNPVSDRVTFRYRLAEQTEIRLELVDIIGRQVKVIAEGTRSPGYHPVVYDTRSLSAGTYFYRQSSATTMQSKRLLIVR